MDEKILDGFYFENKEIKNNEDIKKRLLRDGIQKSYELKNGLVIAKESEAVQVKIQLIDGKVSVKSKFPQIGNSVQVLSSMVFLGASFIFNVPFPFPWVVAIVGGQIFSYLWHYNKIKDLKLRVQNLL